MNYVQHTRAAHEQLRHQPEARPHHISLYWALFFEWNSARFTHELPISKAETMAAARIGNKDTYLSTLRDLQAWGLLTYQPSKSGSSTVQMKVLDGAEVGPEVGQQVGPEVGRPKPAGRPKSGPTVGPKVGQQKAEVGPEVGQHSLLYKTVDVNSINSAASPEKKIREVFSDDGLSSAEVLDDTAPHDGAVPTPGAGPKKKVAPKKKGVRAETIRTAATAQANGTAGSTARRNGPRRQARPETTFQESAIYPKDKFVAAFEGTDYALADLHHYHEAVNLWRDKKTGELPRRADWVATAKKFMFNDATDNRLKLAANVQRHDGSTSSSTANPGGPATGYRSKRWD